VTPVKLPAEKKRLDAAPPASLRGSATPAATHFSPPEALDIMRLLLVTLLLAVVFVFLTAGPLPPVVAVHFAVGGAANGFMPKANYLRFTMALLIGLPLLIVFFSSLTTILPPRLINLPNREYWLAPERQADTLAYLRKHGTHFGVILVLFLCFVHWLVVRANTHNPPLFPESLFFIGMAAFLVSLIAWLSGFVAHFRRRP